MKWSTACLRAAKDMRGISAALRHCLTHKGLSSGGTARPPTSTIKSIARRISGTSWRRSIIVRAICSPSRKLSRALAWRTRKRSRSFRKDIRSGCSDWPPVRIC